MTHGLCQATADSKDQTPALLLETAFRDTTVQPAATKHSLKSTARDTLLCVLGFGSQVKIKLQSVELKIKDRSWESQRCPSQWHSLRSRWPLPHGAKCTDFEGHGNVHPEDVFPVEISKLFQNRYPCGAYSVLPRASLCRQQSQLPSHHWKWESCISCLSFSFSNMAVWSHRLAQSLIKSTTLYNSTSATFLA